MGRDDPQFNLRLPYELKEKVKQRAKANGRSLNAELVQIVADSLEKPTPVIGYRDDAEREADIVSREIQELVFEKLKDFYRKIARRTGLYSFLQAIYMLLDMVFVANALPVLPSMFAIAP